MEDETSVVQEPNFVATGPTAKCRCVLLCALLSHELHPSSRFGTSITSHNGYEDVTSCATVRNLQTRWHHKNFQLRHFQLYLLGLYYWCDGTDILAYRSVFTKQRTTLPAHITRGSVLCYVIFRYSSDHWHWHLHTGWMSDRQTFKIPGNKVEMITISRHWTR